MSKRVRLPPAFSLDLVTHRIRRPDELERVLVETTDRILTGLERDHIDPLQLSEIEARLAVAAEAARAALARRRQAGR
jgi:hypothetical protein